MTEKYHVVYSGWMIKSPPEKKLTGPWKIFRARWKRRYFVLSKPAQSLYDTYLLNYYSDENCKRVRGSIDLEQCAEIIESLDSDQFQYLLAIKTTHRSKDRTYFLATETEEQMTTWVRNLCTVCGMKPDETDSTPQPPVREEPVRNRPIQTASTSEDSQRSRPVQSVQPQPRYMPQVAVGVMTKPPASLTQTVPTPSRPNIPTGVTSSTVRSKPTVTPAAAERDSEYIPLEECSSGSVRRPKRANRQESISSMPDEEAPPPPNFRPGITQDDVYDVPPSTNILEEEDLYKVPPPRSSQNIESLEAYDVPPPRNSPSTPRSSSSDSQKGDSAYSSQGLTYDVLLTRSNLTEDEVYDIPPSHHNTPISLDQVPPSRPPKPGHLQSNVMSNSQEAYMNLPTNSKVFSDKGGKNVDINSVVAPPLPHSGMVLPQSVQKLDLYDFPKPSAESVIDHSKHLNGDVNDKLLLSTPPPPTICGTGSGDHRYINTGSNEPAQDMYLPMDSTLGTDSVVTKLRNSSSTDNEVEYTDMSGKSSFDDSFEGRSSIYDHPPPSRPTIPPPRPSKPASTLEKQDTYSIFSTARTRSFKKKSEESPRVQKKLSSGAKPQVVKSSMVQLPQRKINKGHNPDFSTSDEDDEDMGSPDVWGTTPPAPSNKDTELKYVDLEHEDNADKEPLRSPHAASGTVNQTEYHEIDFVKTDALKSVRENIDVERSKEKNHT